MSTTQFVITFLMGAVSGGVAAHLLTRIKRRDYRSLEESYAHSVIAAGKLRVEATQTEDKYAAAKAVSIAEAKLRHNAQDARNAMAADRSKMAADRDKYKELFDAIRPSWQKEARNRVKRLRGEVGKNG